ncbi:hypothetical protein Zmor_012385 [Zophobas morio]|uniref:Uncharacterized protein n=1 Tax=Zophobas morio TaxID=2755281 RepID=A0AA38HHD0_9CUCU|nr:hypothetical protein Zmor_012385 [Zophobas morio]
MPPTHTLSVKIDLQIYRNGMQAFLRRGKEQEFAEILYFSETNMRSELPQPSGSLEGVKTLDGALRKRTTEVRQRYALCGAIEPRSKASKIASEEQPSVIFKDYLVLIKLLMLKVRYLTQISRMYPCLLQEVDNPL